MNYINANQATYNARLFYSTPSIYAEAIKSANPTLPTKSDGNLLLFYNLMVDY